MVLYWKKSIHQSCFIESEDVKAMKTGVCPKHPIYNVCHTTHTVFFYICYECFRHFLSFMFLNTCVYMLWLTVTLIYRTGLCPKYLDKRGLLTAWISLTVNWPLTEPLTYTRLVKWKINHNGYTIYYTK